MRKSISFVHQPKDVPFFLYPSSISRRMRHFSVILRSSAEGCAVFPLSFVHLPKDVLFSFYPSSTCRRMCRLPFILRSICRRMIYIILTSYYRVESRRGRWSAKSLLLATSSCDCIRFWEQLGIDLVLLQVVTLQLLFSVVSFIFTVRL